MQDPDHDDVVDDETLVALLTGELTAAQRSALVERVARDEELRRRLRKLADCFDCPAADGDGPLDADLVKDSGEWWPDGALAPHSSPPVEPPRGLADQVALHLQTADAADAGTANFESAPPRRRFSAVEAGVLAIAAGLVFAIASPALLANRESARRLGCEEQMMRIGRAVLAYGNEHGGRLPEIGPADTAGLYSVLLADGHYAPRDELRSAVVCAASPLAETLAVRGAALHVPTLLELRSSPAWVRRQLEHLIGGSYAYALPHIEAGRLAEVRNCGDCRMPILSDAPVGPRWASVHRGGQNVLFHDNSLRFVTGPWRPGAEDHLFANRRGDVAAATSPHDVVLAPSGVGPGVSPAVARRTFLQRPGTTAPWSLRIESLRRPGR